MRYQSPERPVPFWKHPAGICILILAALGLAISIAIVVVLVQLIREEGMKRRTPADAVQINADVRGPIARPDFRGACYGIQPENVIKRVGRPDSTVETESGEIWYYRGRTFDPVSNKRDLVAIVEFSRHWGRGDNIRFIGN